MIQKSLLLTRREIEVIDKKLKNMKLTQQDSNYLSRFVRPKLKEISLVNAKTLLEKLEYNPKFLSIEKRIRGILLKKIKDIASITIYGSAIYNSYKNYRDIDILVIVKKRFWQKTGEKYKKILEIKKQAKKHIPDLDLKIYDEKTFQDSYSSNISLIYQLKDRKTIYGNLKLPNKLEISKLDLRMKTDYSILENDEYDGLEIYKALRNLILIILTLSKIIDNKKLIKYLNDEIGMNLVEKLKLNKESKIEKEIALLHLKKLLKSVLRQLEKSKWEKIVLLNH